MAKIGLHHLSFASTDYEGTVEFYTKVMGWPIAWQDQAVDPETGQELLRHVFFQADENMFVAFICSVPGSPMFPEKIATDINSGLGLPTGIYHFAFSVDTVEELDSWRRQIDERGGEASAIVDHGWCKSVYFRDPVNDLMLEIAVQSRKFNDDDKILKQRQQDGIGIEFPEEIERSARIMGVTVADFELRRNLPVS